MHPYTSYRIKTNAYNYVVLFEVRVVFLDAVVENGDDDASASEIFLPRRNDVHIQADSTILSHNDIYRPHLYC